ncbi:helix-turn-helix transcriptional regulator [Schaalia sp. 19OD2882]|uniref:PadR family transcriptional regulator n=1 Tax=Schaalia sp. 19OD2882 TaxID=2794089 RepID=UPI001C1E8E56|nr:PadR family transcriptional regulator [Schaalia sp. 19OD2882]QWW19561.1 helix-turn-helix transcriptional regulator [Schaalia sp. 19OD2882]
MISADAIRGYIDLMVLSILTSHPSYAYEIAKTITEVSGGEYTIKQTTLYSAVKRLEGAGLVRPTEGTSETGKPRTYYHLTPQGRTHLADKLTEWESTKALVDRFVEGVH